MPGGDSSLVEDEAARPEPAEGELLIRVYAAGLTPSELRWYPTTHKSTGEPRRDAVPGHEFSGVIAALGPGVKGVTAGQEVYGMNDWFAEGAMAEFCVTKPECVAPKPASLTHAQAASVPIGALTAWQGLLDRARLQTGEKVLIHGGAGGVGVFAVQLARRQGAHVIATCSPEDSEFVTGLGADQVIDYRKVPFEKAVRDVDVVFDTVGGDTLERSWKVLKPGGRMITIVGESSTAPDERTKKAFFIVEPNREQLIAVAKLLDEGGLQAVVDITLPIEDAPAAYDGKLQDRRGRGKLVVVMSREIGTAKG